ncbi:MAG: squalene synthase HpnC [Gammaproteobacteria bacterium]|nr:squalene synthase HpnC [Gammaproteobacteria bacterium]
MSPPSAAQVREAYQHCLGLAFRHYENFPVASIAVPAHLRGPVAAVYAFARSADDFADEGDRTPEARLALLREYGRRLDAIASGVPGDDPVFIALDDCCRRFRLPLSLFHDLLDAFSQDVTRKCYEEYSEVLDYCRRSANPVGRLLLHLYGEAEPGKLTRSDAICSALQLINFLQDIGQDYREHGRIYFPQRDMRECGVSEDAIAAGRTDAAMLRLIDLQLGRIRELLDAGAPLGWQLRGRLGLELRMILFGARRVLDRLAAQREDVFSRPRLTRMDRMGLMWDALTKTYDQCVMGKG